MSVNRHIDYGDKFYFRIGGGMGDVLAITPSLKALKQKYPEKKIHVEFVSEDHLDLLKNNPHIDKTTIFKSRFGYLKKHQTVFNVMKLIEARLVKNKPLFFSVGSLGTYGIYRKRMAHILAEGLGVELNDEKLEMYLTEEELELAKQKVKKLKKIIIINPTVRSNPKRVWPIQRWSSVINHFPDIDFVQLGKPDEQKIEGAITAQELGLNSLREMISVLSLADFYFGSDTFWQHAAAAVAIPGVVLHTNGHPAVFGHEIHTNIYKGLHCAPCLGRLGNSECPYDNRCATSITVDEVVSALSEKINSAK